MTDPAGSQERRSETGPPGMPRWVKVSGIVVVIVALVLIVIMVLAGGEHGPGLHTDAGAAVQFVVGWHGAGML